MGKIIDTLVVAICFSLLYLTGAICAILAYWIFSGTYNDFYRWHHELTTAHILFLLFGVILAILAFGCFCAPFIIHYLTKEK